MSGSVAVPLHLDQRIPIKDVRCMIWSYLHYAEREMIRCAHNTNRRPSLLPWDIQLLCVRGHLELLQWLCTTHGIAWSVDYTACALRANHESIWRWRMSVERAFHYTYVKVVAETPRPDWMEWIYENQNRDFNYCSDHLCRIILHKGHICMLDWLEKRAPHQLLENAIEIAIGYRRDASFLDSLTDRGYIIESCVDAWKCAVALNNLGVLEWLQRHNVPYPRGVSVHTTSEDTLVWMYEHGLPMDWGYVASVAVKMLPGSLRLLQLAYHHGGDRGRITGDLCQYVVRRRKLDMLQWIYSVAPQILLSVPQLDGIMLESRLHVVDDMEAVMVNNVDLWGFYEVDFRIFTWMESIGVDLCEQTRDFMAIYRKLKREK